MRFSRFPALHTRRSGFLRPTSLSARGKANFNVNAVRVAVALPRSKRTSVQRDTNDDLLVIDRRVKRRRAVVANHIRDFIRGGSIVRRVVHDDIFHVLCAGLHRDFQIVFCRR